MGSLRKPEAKCSRSRCSLILSWLFKSTQFQKDFDQFRFLLLFFFCVNNPCEMSSPKAQEGDVGVWSMGVGTLAHIPVPEKGSD